MADSMLLVLALGVNAVYAGLGIAAFSRAKGDSGMGLSRLLALTLWWPFYDIYDDGSSLRKAGLIIFFVMLLLYGSWLYQSGGWPVQ